MPTFTLRHILVISFVLLFFFSMPLYAEDAPKHVNPNPTFKPTPPDQEAALAKAKLGKPPKLSKEQWAEIRKGDIVVLSLKTEGDDRTNEAVGIINAPPKAVMAFMRDYPAYVGVMPHLKKITVEWNGNMAVIEQTLKIALTTVWYRLNLLHYSDYVIEWEFVHGDIKNTVGYYHFFPMNKGRQTLIVYHVNTDPGLPVPQFIIDLLTKGSMPDVIKAIRKATLERMKP